MERRDFEGFGGVRLAADAFGSPDAPPVVLINHNGKNPNFGFVRPAKAYTLVDLFAGISRDDGGWDLGFYAKNVFDRHVELTRSVITPPVADFGPTGYDQVRATLPREIGVTLRYAFGSR